MNRVRCAIYTRKSSDEGLDQAFNSLDAQREACEAYVRSQKHEGWSVLSQTYDDGGVSGGTLERPALRKLLEDIEAGRVDMVVVYKIDRLTRSLADFAKLVEQLDAAGASFVSVTQQFNTSTSMGRLTLNVLLSFAQFEREVTAERIRDKIAASKKKGMWMGGFVPLGYDKTDRGLVINDAEAETVRTLFESYLDAGNVRGLKSFADEQGLKTKRHQFTTGITHGGVNFSRGRLYHLLTNPIYIGQIRHRDQVHEGLHAPIIDQDLWDKVQAHLERNRIVRKARRNAASVSPLAGKLFDEEGRRLTPSHANKHGRRYRYYLLKDSEASGWRLPAAEIETAVSQALANDPAFRMAHQIADTGNAGEVLTDLVERVEIAAEELRIHCDTPDGQSILVRTPFTMRRRGVESKVILDGEVRREPDLVMIRRILRAMTWVDRIKAGESLKEIATAEAISTDYITHNIDLAYLSPNMLSTILEGRLSPDITTADLSRQRWPVDWAKQRDHFRI